MRNRAKCKLCGDIIESFHRYDYIYCKCNEIGISGGNHEYHVSAKDFKNFLRIDDDDNIVEVILKDFVDDIDSPLPSMPTQDELLEMLDEMRKKIENLPREALYSPVTHADFASLMMLLLSIFKSKDDNGAKK